MRCCNGLIKWDVAASSYNEVVQYFAATRCCSWLLQWDGTYDIHTMVLKWEVRRSCYYGILQCDVTMGRFNDLLGTVVSGRWVMSTPGCRHSVEVVIGRVGVAVTCNM